MSGHGEKLSRQQEAAIAALLTEPTHAAAASAAGIGEATLRRWLRVPSFQAAYRQARRELVESAVGRVQAATGHAVDALVQVARHGGRDGDRVRAAVALLDHAFRGLRDADAIHGDRTPGDGPPMGTCDVVRVLAGRLRQVERAELPTAEKARLTGTLADALLRAIGVDVLDEAGGAAGGARQAGGKGEVMNANTLARQYDKLTPEERFSLILAAGGRGDEVEQDRLVKAGGRVTLTFPEHAPYARAFDELATLTFIELLDDAATYEQADEQAGDALDFCRGEGGADEGDADEEDAGHEEADAEKPPAWARYLELAYAAGYVLRTKAEGWELFCERLGVAPLLLWRRFPGLERLQRALALAKDAAFDRAGMLGWMNRIRPAGAAELTEFGLTAERVAEANEEAFRHQVKWWCG